MMVRRSGRYTVDFRRYRDSMRFLNKNDIPKIEEKNEEENLKNEDIFLKGILESPKLPGYETCEKPFAESDLIIKPVSLGNTIIIKQLSEYRGTNIRTIEQAELAILLSKPHLKAVIEAHDKIGANWLLRLNGADPNLTATIDNSVFVGDDGEMPAETIKVVGLRKSPNQPLGLTVGTDKHGQVVVARIMAGGTAARQGLVKVGDVILEVDGQILKSPDQLRTACAESGDTITLKVGPASLEPNSSNGDASNGLTCYVRTLFEYDPEDDTLLPCKEIGLKFNRWEILQVSDRRDPNWWQASKVDSPGVAGLIPSPELEERRKAYVPPEADFVHTISICGARISRKKKKIPYESRACADKLDSAELALYEEVARTPPFARRVLALVGGRGVGRRTIKGRLLSSDPQRFGTVAPHTSRPPRPLEEDGAAYWFVSREIMEKEAQAGHFLEYGDHNGHLYGTHLDSIRQVLQQGKMCILDCAPNSLKLLHNSSEFLPFVVFIAAPGMEQLRTLDHSSSRNLQFDRQSSIRFSSRRARTLESLASLYEEDDLRSTLEESACLQRTYDRYIDLVAVNQDFDETFRRILDALDALATEHQWVPVNWIY